MIPGFCMFNTDQGTSNSEHPLQLQQGFKDSLTSILGNFHVVGHFNILEGGREGDRPVGIHDPEESVYDWGGKRSGGSFVTASAIRSNKDQENLCLCVYVRLTSCE